METKTESEGILDFDLSGEHTTPNKHKHSFKIEYNSSEIEVETSVVFATCDTRPWTFVSQEYGTVTPPYTHTHTTTTNNLRSGIVQSVAHICFENAQDPSARQDHLTGQKPS